MPIQISPFRRRPEHVVCCAIPECRKLGLRSSVCSSCNEYHCVDHFGHVVVGNEVDRENFSSLRSNDPDGHDGARCFPCGNSPPRLEIANPLTEGLPAVESRLESLGREMTKSALRTQFADLMLHRYKKLLDDLDLLKESPLEQRLWAALLVRGLDVYLAPQVELYDYAGRYIVRVDFASTLLRLAIFTDGRTYHSSEEAKTRDDEHNRRLAEVGWMVMRYWTEEVNNDVNSLVDRVYDTVCQRIAEMQRSGLPVGYVHA